MTEKTVISKLPQEIREKLAKRSRDKGSNYERDVAKKIASYFGWPWDQAFYRTKPHGHAQPNGDIQPINDMYDMWRAAKLGPIECKNRKEWSFNNLFKDPEHSYLGEYWKKSNGDTKHDNTVLIFTKPGVTDFVMFPCDVSFSSNSPHILAYIGGYKLVVQTLKDFLNEHWPKT